MREKETVAASKRLARLLSEKWKRPYSQVVGMVRSRITVALVRASSRCSRDSRDTEASIPALTLVEGTSSKPFRYGVYAPVIAVAKSRLIVVS